MLIYANVAWNPILLGTMIYQIKDKPFFIPHYKIKNTAIEHMKLKSNVHCLAISFIDQNKVAEIKEYTKKEFDTLKGNAEFDKMYKYIMDLDEKEETPEVTVEVEGI